MNMKGNYVMAASENSREISIVGDIAARRKCLVFYPEQFIKIILVTMQKTGTGCAGVVDESWTLLGMLTEREILRRIFALVADSTINHANLGKHIDHMTVRDVMIANPVTLAEDMDIEDALAVMGDRGFRYMPVVSTSKGNKLVGLVDEREVTIHVRTRLDRVKREALQKEWLLNNLFSEPYGPGFNVHSD
jgi:CBS domain-containing protein